jgi:hypothetical protein
MVAAGSFRRHRQRDRLGDLAALMKARRPRETTLDFPVWFAGMRCVMPGAPNSAGLSPQVPDHGRPTSSMSGVPPCGSRYRSEIAHPDGSPSRGFRGFRGRILDPVDSRLFSTFVKPLRISSGSTRPVHVVNVRTLSQGRSAPVRLKKDASVFDT